MKPHLWWQSRPLMRTRRDKPRPVQATLLLSLKPEHWKQVSKKMRCNLMPVLDTLGFRREKIDAECELSPSWIRCSMLLFHSSSLAWRGIQGILSSWVVKLFENVVTSALMQKQMVQTHFPLTYIYWKEIKIECKTNYMSTWAQNLEDRLCISSVLWLIPYFGFFYGCR